jgi:arabinogalactan endo-1,4-beta-galactosidase
MRLTLFFILLAYNCSAQIFMTGADLSYTNELEDCGTIYYETGAAKDPYQIFTDHNCQIARFRLWHTPTWTSYSNLDDVKKSLGRAKAGGMSTLLDFHYSDTWADPANQLIPAAWQNITDLNVLSDSLYNYTYSTLNKLLAANLLPDIVQTGNETNGNILLKEGEALYPLDWTRNAKLFNRAAKAVRDFNTANGTSIKIIVHIAGPDNANWWFDSMRSNGFTNYDIIGLSYYPQWYGSDIHKVGGIIKQLKQTFGKEVMIVETACPWTFQANDNANNIQNNTNLLKCFGEAPSPAVQKQFLTDFTWLVYNAGGMGVIYWEPGWVSSDCQTPWGTGSNWENSTFFDFTNNLHQGIEFMQYDYNKKPAELDSVRVAFKVHMNNTDTTNGVFVTGDFTGMAWKLKRMKHMGSKVFEYFAKVPCMSSGAFIFRNKADWANSSMETLPAACALYWDTHREYVINASFDVIGCNWGSCLPLGINEESGELNKLNIEYYFADNQLNIWADFIFTSATLSNLSGVIVKSASYSGCKNTSFNIANLQNGIYILKVVTAFDEIVTKKVLITK